jgi:hypothetical protein
LIEPLKGLKVVEEAEEAEEVEVVKEEVGKDQEVHQWYRHSHQMP